MPDRLAARFKAYESTSEQLLPARLPVILRMDGHAFSKLTEREDFDKPFDERFLEAMHAAATDVLEFCSGAELAYVQSDEISVLLRNDHTEQTEPFLGNRTQKVASLTASRAAVTFNRMANTHGIPTEALFDCRAFVVPYAEVKNYFLWRQNDAFKNCVGTFAYWELRKKYDAKKAHEMLHGLSTNERQELIFQEFGVNPNEIATKWKRGVCIRRVEREQPLREVLAPEKLDELLAQGHVDNPDEVVTRRPWEVDKEIPRFNQEPGYIEAFLPR